MMRWTLALIMLLIATPGWSMPDENASTLSGGFEVVLPFAMNFPKECWAEARSADDRFSEVLSNYDRSYESRMLAEEVRAAAHSVRVDSLARFETKGRRCFEAYANYFSIARLDVLSIQTADISRKAQVLLALLHRQGRLKPIARAARATLGGYWVSRQAKSGKFSLLGAYDCRTGILYYDPYLPEGDLAATLLHEVEHLLRDRLLAPLEGLPIRDQILADEWAATMKAGFHQTNLVDKKDFEFNLFQWKGSLHSSSIDFRDWQRSSKHQGDGLEDLISFMTQDRSGRARLEQTIETTARGYFSERGGFPRALFHQLIARKVPASFLDPIEEKSRLGGPKNAWVHLPKTSQAAREFFALSARYLEPTFASHLKKIEAATSPSLSCKKFLEANASGELQSYLGSKVAAPGEVLKPGNEGVKPCFLIDDL